MTTTRWVLLCLIAAAIWAMPQSQAIGGDANANFCVSDFWGRCLHVARHRHAYRWRYYQHRHRRHGHRHRDHDHDHDRWRVPGSGERIDHGLFCHARRRVVGEDAQAPLGTGTLGNRKDWIQPAQSKALKAWMGAVRYDHGERYQDIANAKDVRETCDFAGYGGATGKRRSYRCVLEATPCRAPPSAADEVERRIEIEQDEK